MDLTNSGSFDKIPLAEPGGFLLFFILRRRNHAVRTPRFLTVSEWESLRQEHFLSDYVTFDQSFRRGVFYLPKKRILIIEDEKQIARFLELELNHEGYEVRLAADGRAGLQYLRENICELVLLDIMLPEINGFEVCRRVRQFSNLPVIMLTARDEVTSKVMGLDCGADDYITKPFAIEELLARIRVVLRRNGGAANSKLLLTADLEMNSATRQVKRAAKPIELTKKEYDLLEYFLLNKNIVLTREQLLDKVWGYEFCGETNIVDVYIKYLRAKIDEPFPVKLIQTVRGVGYMLKEEPA